MVTMYGGGEGGVVSGMGSVNSGMFVLLKVWWVKGFFFGVEGGINSCLLISSSIAF